MAVELRRSNQAHDRGGPFPGAQRTGEQPIRPARRKFVFILPISGKKLKSNTAGIPCMVAASRFET
nr:hypothetical protein [Burkholderia vietnamiensis]